MKEESAISGYRYLDAGHSCAHAYLLPTLKSEVAMVRKRLDSSPKRLFDLGCGNGSVADFLTKLGWEVSGVDPSHEGIAAAKAAYPHLQGSVAQIGC